MNYDEWEACGDMIKQLYKVEWFPDDEGTGSLRTGWVIAESPQDALDRAEDEAFGVDVADEDDPINEYNPNPPEKQSSAGVLHMLTVFEKDREYAREELDRIDTIIMSLEELIRVNPFLRKRGEK